MIELCLPYPVSTNRYWRPINLPNGRHIFVVTKEAKEFKEAVGWIARIGGVRSPIKGRVALEYVLHPKLPQDWRTRCRKDPAGWEDTVQCIDLDNAQKVLLDALKDIVFEDDKWVREIVARRGEPLGEACLVLKVRPLAVDVPQTSLLEAAA